MDIDKKYFSNITTRERAIFEGAISMGALFHQFVGTPVNKDTKESLEKAMEESLSLQPAIEKVEVEIRFDKLEESMTPKTKENITLEELMNTWMAKLNNDCFFISAKEKTNMDELKSIIYNKVKELHVQKYPYNDFLYQTYEE